jgi:hypothetical protein
MINLKPETKVIGVIILVLVGLGIGGYGASKLVSTVKDKRRKID